MLDQLVIAKYCLSKAKGFASIQLLGFAEAETLLDSAIGYRLKLRLADIDNNNNITLYPNILISTLKQIASLFALRKVTQSLRLCLLYYPMSTQ